MSNTTTDIPSRPSRPCNFCNTFFQPLRPWQVFCSDLCRSRGYWRKRGKLAEYYEKTKPIKVEAEVATHPNHPCFGRTDGNGGGGKLGNGNRSLGSGK
jgi:hypothetical protein